MSAYYPNSPNVERWRNLVRQIGIEVGYPHTNLALAQIDLESGGDPNILTRGATPCTPGGARGLMQLTPFYEWNNQPSGVNFSNCADCDVAYQDPGFNLRVGLTYMAQGLAKFGSIIEALEDYNTGEPNPTMNPEEYANEVFLRIPAYDIL